MFKRKGFILIVSYILINIFTIKIGENLKLEESLILLISSIIMFAVALWLYKDHLASEWRRLKENHRIRSVFLRSLGTFILVGVFRAITIALLEKYIDVNSLGQNQQALDTIQQNSSMLSFFFVAVINAPIVEELIFRQVMNGWVSKDAKILTFLMAVFSTYLFTQAHAFVWADFIIYLPLSIALYLFYYLYDRNVWGSIILHFTNNFIAVALMFLIPYLPDDIKEQMGVIFQWFVNLFQ